MAARSPDQSLSALRSREDLSAIAASFISQFARAARGGQGKSLKRLLKQPPLVMQLSTARAMLTLHARLRAIVESDYATGTTESAQFGAALAALLEARHAHVTLLEQGGARASGKDGSVNAAELPFLAELVRRLQEHTDGYLFRYGTRHGSARKPRRPPASAFASDENESPAQQQQQQQVVLTPLSPLVFSPRPRALSARAAPPGPMHALVEAPVAHFEARAAESGADLSPLFERCRDAGRLRAELGTWRVQGFHPTVQAMLVADTFARALLQASADSRLRAAHAGLLRECYASARANAVATLASVHGLRLGAVPVATDADTDQIFAGGAAR